jgi:hypothetical protein
MIPAFMHCMYSARTMKLAHKRNMLVEPSKPVFECVGLRSNIQFVRGTFLTQSMNELRPIMISYVLIEIVVDDVIMTE